MNEGNTEIQPGEIQAAQRQLDPRADIFSAYSLDATGRTKLKIIHTRFAVLLEDLFELVPEGRELSLVQTKLQEACFFAVRGMAKTNSEPQT